MSNEKAFHQAAARCVGLRTELGQEKQCPQNNDKRVDDDPLLVQLEDVMQQGVFQQLQLAERAISSQLLPGLEDLVQGTNFPDTLCCPLKRLAALTRSSTAAFCSVIPSATSCFKAAMRPCFLRAV